MKERPNFYAILPASIRYSKQLSDFQKILYAEISSLTQSNGYCYAKNSYFAELYEKNIASISRSITKLVKQGFISREIKYKDDTKEVKARFLRVVPLENTLTDKNINTSIDKNINTPIDKNAKDNSTSKKQYKNITGEKIYKKENFIDYSFNDFYELYPNKKSKDQAFKFWNKAIDANDFPRTLQELHLTLLPLIVKTEFGYPMKYIKHPGTWLNQGCWNDEYSLDEITDELVGDIPDFCIKKERRTAVKEFINEQIGAIRHEKDIRHTDIQ